MKIFLTGATGFIGGRLAERLVRDMNEVTLLVRNPGSLDEHLRINTTVLTGLLSDSETMSKGMEGCDIVFHLAAYARHWSDDPEEPFRINVTGTANLLRSALYCGVKRVVLTSTAGLMGYSRDGNPVGETTNPGISHITVYEQTKAAAESLAADYCRKGLDVIIVNPSRVYGPGKLSKSNSLTGIINSYIRGSWRILPGNGKVTGNYVFIDDVVEGHLLAALKGRPGERYILGGENLTFRELFGVLGKVSGRTRILIPVPVFIMRIVTGLSIILNRVCGIPPFITREWLDKLMNNWIMSSRKAQEELGYRITPFGTGAKKTIEWIRSGKI